MNEATLYEVRQGAAWITLNRPQNRNALSAVLVNELDAHLAGALEDPAVRCIVITGTDPAFCAGADLKNPPGQSSDGERAVSLPEVLKRMLDSPKPVIAAVQMGCAHRAVPREQLHAAVQEEIDAICLGGPIAVAECKKLVRRVPQLSTDEGFAEMAVWSRRMFGTPEAAEGMSAFREKRKPGWVTGG